MKPLADTNAAAAESPSLANYRPSEPKRIEPPEWLKTATDNATGGSVDLTKYWAESAPDVQSVAGEYSATESWMLVNHVRDMERGRSFFCIAPMGVAGGVGTYRLGMK